MFARAETARVAVQPSALGVDAVVTPAQPGTRHARNCVGCGSRVQEESGAALRSARGVGWRCLHFDGLIAVIFDTIANCVNFVHIRPALSFGILLSHLNHAGLI